MTLETFLSKYAHSDGQILRGLPYRLIRQHYLCFDRKQRHYLIWDYDRAEENLDIFICALAPEHGRQMYSTVSLREHIVTTVLPQAHWNDIIHDVVEAGGFSACNYQQLLPAERDFTLFAGVVYRQLRELGYFR